MKRILMLALTVFGLSIPLYSAVCDNTGESGDYNLCVAIGNKCRNNCARFGPPSPTCTAWCDNEQECCIYGGNLN